MARALHQTKDDVFANFEGQLSLFDDDGEVLAPANETSQAGTDLQAEGVKTLEAMDFTAPPVGDAIQGADPAVSVLSGEPIQTIEISKAEREQELLDLLEGLRNASSEKVAFRITKAILEARLNEQQNIDISDLAARTSRKDAAYDVVRLMAEEKHDFSAKQVNTGMTALHYAAAFGSQDGVATILKEIEPLSDAQRQSVLDAVDNDEATALTTAMFYSASPGEHIPKELLRAGADFLHIKENGQNAYEALGDQIELLRKNQEANGTLEGGKTLEALTNIQRYMDTLKQQVELTQTQNDADPTQSSKVEALLRAAHAFGHTAPDAPERQERLDALLAAISDPDLDIQARVDSDVFRQYVEESEATLPQKDTTPEIEADRAYKFGMRFVEGAEMKDALRLTSALLAVDAQRRFREQIQEGLSEDSQQVLVSALKQYVQTSGEEKKNINVADQPARQAVVDLLDSLQAGVPARSRADFKSDLNAWMQSLLKTDIATTGSVFIKLHEVNEARAKDDPERSPKRIIKDITHDSLRQLVQTGATLLGRMRGGQENLLHAAHVMVSRLRWMQGSEKRDVYQTIEGVSGNEAQSKQDRQALDGLLHRDTQELFDKVTEFLDGLSDDLTGKTFERAKLPFVEGLTSPNTQALMWTLSANSHMSATANAIYDSIAAGHSTTAQSAIIAALDDAADVRLNREAEMVRRAAPRMAIEAVCAMLKSADPQEKQEIVESMVQAGANLTEQRAANQSNVNVLPLADVDMDGSVFASFVKAQATQNAANTYLSLAIAGAAEIASDSFTPPPVKNEIALATGDEDQALRSQILRAGAAIEACTPALTPGQRIALTYAAYQAQSSKSDLLSSEPKDTHFVLQQSSKQTIEATLSAQAMGSLKAIRQTLAQLSLNDSLVSCARCAHDISSATNIHEVPRKEALFLCVGSTVTGVVAKQQGNKPVELNLHAQSLWDCRSAGENLANVTKGALEPETNPRPLFTAALQLQEEFQQRAADLKQELDNQATAPAPRYTATVVRSPASTPEDEWARVVPTPMTRFALYRAVRDSAPEGYHVDSSAPFWDVPQITLDTVQERFSDILQQQVQRGLNPASIDFADGARYDGKVAVPCNRFMEADGSVSRALQEAGVDYDDAGRHIENYAHVYIDAEAVGTFKAALTGNLVKRFEAYLPYGLEAENANVQQWAACISQDCRDRAIGRKDELYDALETVAQARAFGASDKFEELESGFINGVDAMLAAAAASTPEARKEEQLARRLLREQGREPRDESEIPLTGHTAADLRLASDEIEAQKQDMEAAARQEYAQERGRGMEIQ